MLEHLGISEYWQALIAAGIMMLAVWPQWLIVKKAGFRPQWSFLTLVPVLGLAMVYVFAFARWPVLEEPEPAPAVKKRSRRR